MSKIGVGIITYNRPDFFDQCLNSIDSKKINNLIVVNDGTPYKSVNAPLIQHEKNQGVGKSKNSAFKFLLEKGCDHIFLIEDDIIIKNNNVFDAYIDASNTTGIKHMMYGYHGPANKKNGIPNPRYIFDYGNNMKIAMNQHCVGAFCYYTRDVLENVGLNDETFINAWEHVEHSYRIVKTGYLPSYWWWPDIKNSSEYIDELACSEVNSTIRPQSTWRENITNGAKYFISKHGLSPVSIPDTSLDAVTAKLKKIHTDYAKH